MLLSPALCFLLAATGLCLIFFKYWQVFYLSRRAHHVIPVSTQVRYFRQGLILSIMASIVPFTVFLASTTECGPHSSSFFSAYQNELYYENQAEIAACLDNTSLTVNSTFCDTSDTDPPILCINCTWLVGEVFFEELQETFPGWLLVVLNYVTNPMLLWMGLIVLLILLFGKGRLISTLDDEIEELKVAVKAEQDERARQIKKLGGAFRDDTQLEGVEFFADLGKSLTSKYRATIENFCHHDLRHLFKMSEIDRQPLKKEIGNEEDWNLIHSLLEIFASRLVLQELQKDREPNKSQEKASDDV
jgi:hypothetical protein